MTPFFITGLPRSRTAWLANLFTVGAVTCWHEPTKPIALLVRESGPGVRVRRIGVSDASLTLRWEELLKEYPEARWLYVERRPEDVLKSLAHFLEGRVHIGEERLRSMIALHGKCAEGLKGQAQALVVKFEDLGREEVVWGAWDWLLPNGPEFDVRRYQAIKDLNVQVDIERVVKTIVGASLAERT